MKKNLSLINFGLHIKKLRLAHGYSQESFADACDIHRTYMSGIERGTRNISFLVAIKMAKTLKIELSDLFPTFKQLSKEITQN